MLDELRRAGEYDRTLIVVTADHGEGRYRFNLNIHFLFILWFGDSAQIGFGLRGKLHFSHRVLR